MSGAMNSAKSGQTKDSQDPAGTCPLKLSKLQLIPVRYALVESQPEHPAISSRLKPEVSYRPVGVRPIDEGYIYLIHSQRQNIIYVYHIQPDGKVIKLEQQQLVDGQSGEEYVYLESEQGLFVAREGTIEVLFSPTKISPKLQSQLLDSENLRAKMMQTCDVGSFSCLTGARHLLPTSALESNMADCNPENSDYEEAYRWCWLKDKPQQVDSNELLSQIEPEFELDSAVLILEDPMGVMTELSNCDNSVINMEVEWFQQDNNRAKYFAATQIKLLIEVGERQFNANTNNEKLMNFIKSDEEKLKQRFIDYTQSKSEYWSFVTDKTRGYSQYSLGLDSIETSHEFQNYQYQRQLNLEMAKRIGIDQSELEFFFHQVKKENDDQVEGEFGGWLGDRGILARIEYEDMEAWFSSAQKKIEQWHIQGDKIENDRVAVMPFAYDIIPVFDKENKDEFLARLVLENHWIEDIAEYHDNKEKVRDFFFGTVGEQNLHTYVGNKENIGTIDDKYLDWKEWVQYIAPSKGVYDNANNTLDGLSGLHDFQALLTGLHLIEIDKVADSVKEQLNRFAINLSSLAIDELNELAKSIDSTQERVNSFIYQARPGMIAALLGHKKNANIMLDVGVNSGIESFNREFSKLENIRMEAEKVINQRALVESKKLTTAQKDSLRADYNRQLKLLGEEAEQTLMALATRSEPIAKSGSKHLPSQIIIKASGVTAEEVNELLEIRRKVLKNELLYGVSEGTSFRGAIGSGSAALVVFALNVWNWTNTKEAFSKKSALTITESFEYFSGFTSLLSSAASISLEIAKVKSSLNWISMSNKADYRVLSKVITFGSAGISTLTLFSSGTDLLKQQERMKKSWRNGDFASVISSSSAFVGDSIQGWHSGKIAGKTFLLAASAAQGQVTWTAVVEQAFGLVARSNPYMLFASLLILGGEIGYNFIKSSPLMNWVSKSSWGKSGFWFWYDNQNWSYDEQFTSWLEATQAPIVQIATKTFRQQQLSASGNMLRYVTKHRVKKLRIWAPMATPRQVKIAGFVKTVSNKESLDITNELVDNGRVKYDGSNTLFEFDWPQDIRRQKKLRYLDLMVEVTSQYGNKLFSEQGGARFTIDLLEPATGDKKDWYQIELLEDNDLQAVDGSVLVGALKQLEDKIEEYND